MPRKVWLEAALNGPWSRALQPLIPINVDEVVSDGIACAKAGAAIIHLHAYDAVTGRQNDDAETYARIIEGIRAKTDAIVYPTIPFAQNADVFASGSAHARYSAVEFLAERGLLEWAVVDPGSVNLATLKDVAANRPTSIYLNPEAHIRRGLELCQQYKAIPSYAIYEPGFVRLGAALARNYPNLPPPVYRLMFTDNFTFGYAPRTYALQSYLELLKEEAPGAPWMAAGLGVDIVPLIGDVVAFGGHVRVGLEDAPLGTNISNLTWTERAAAIIEKSGGALATAAEIRSDLAALKN